MYKEAINITIFIRDIYVRRDTKIFSSVQQFADIINEQIGIRASLICGKLPAEEVLLIILEGDALQELLPLTIIMMKNMFSTCNIRFVI